MKLNLLIIYGRSIFEAVDNNTIVFVFGDHGMTEIGEHAGDTPEEVDSALLIYSPQSIFDHKKVCYNLKHVHSVIEMYLTCLNKR